MSVSNSEIEHPQTASGTQLQNVAEVGRVGEDECVQRRSEVGKGWCRAGDEVRGQTPGGGGEEKENVE